MIYLSQNAADKMNQMNKNFIKVKVFFGGCNGFKYEFSFPQSCNEGDIIFKHGSKSIITDQFTLSRISESTVDFLEELMEERFLITSSNFKKTCHCGTSFKA
ncbi:iron-sulfur cluster assembly accessory protein [Candidatus Cytomitobacter indipagum]|uniref:Iron-sulfur cluster assembly accessory protein n=1 Tax=Candidatus Cytomitobacter indipagum TaxID=2601575 RepID=A0A5C0UD08_9PROT|nr:iron-sulfur cluster assembly accessory protein [Candidatus Cytomitobacter indipagum]QEK37905.1 iron-sulfur cluster assembly accessory protein [Candidatus Cytomitobacter indipagum]